MSLVTVTTAPTPLAARTDAAQNVSFQVPDGGATVYVDTRSDVTIGTGVIVQAGSLWSIDLPVNGNAWAIVAASTQDVRVTRTPAR